MTKNIYAGYINVNPPTDRNLFYWFTESQNSPATDPVVLVSFYLSFHLISAYMTKSLFLNILLFLTFLIFGLLSHSLYSTIM